MNSFRICVNASETSLAEELSQLSPFGWGHRDSSCLAGFSSFLTSFHTCLCSQPEVGCGLLRQTEWKHGGSLYLHILSTSTFSGETSLCPSFTSNMSHVAGNKLIQTEHRKLLVLLIHYFISSSKQKIIFSFIHFTQFFHLKLQIFSHDS